MTHRYQTIFLIRSLLVFLIRPSASEDQQMRGNLDLASTCSSEFIQVKAVHITCDSPGAYYSGSGSYRASLRCKSGDRANLYVSFAIKEDLSSDGVDISIDSGAYGSLSSVISKVNACKAGNIKVLMDDDDNYYRACPEAGSYGLYIYFSIPNTLQDYELQYTPDIRVRFFSHLEGTEIGCATTGTPARFTNATHHSRNGEIALGLALTFFILLFGCLLYIAYKRKKRMEQEMTERRYHYYTGDPRQGQTVPFDSGSTEKSTTGSVER